MILFVYSEVCCLHVRDKYKSNSRKILFCTIKGVALIVETNTRVTVSRPFLCSVKGIALIEETIKGIIVERTGLCTVNDVALIEEKNTRVTV